MAKVEPPTRFAQTIGTIVIVVADNPYRTYAPNRIRRSRCQCRPTESRQASMERADSRLSSLHSPLLRQS